MIDLNSNPERVHEPGSNHQVRVLQDEPKSWLSFSFMFLNFLSFKEQGIDVNRANGHEHVGVVPVGAFKKESNK